jgi:two-component system, chemotaxis family, chemotaxis protein CheY
MNVLIVDDSATMRMIVIKSLRQAGFESMTIIEAGSAKEALQKIAAGGVDLVLSDVNMPEITGIELVKVIRTKFKSLPIIMVTTESSPEMKEKMRQAGANEIISKPFQPEDLKKVIDGVLK